MYVRLQLCHCTCVVSDDNHGNNNDLAAVIGGVVGGFALLLMIIVVLCIVVLCMRRCHRMEDKNVSCNTVQLNTDATIENNPSYDVTQAIEPRDSDVPFTANPSCSVSTRPYSKTSEDIYNYIQPDEFTQHLDLDGYLQMDTNTSYGVSIVKENSTALGATSDPKTYQSSNDATAKEYDYANASNDQVLHYSSNTGGAKQDNVQIYTDTSHNTNISPSHYFTLVTNSTELIGGGRK